MITNLTPEFHPTRKPPGLLKAEERRPGNVQQGAHISHGQEQRGDGRRWHLLSRFLLLADRGSWRRVYPFADHPLMLALALNLLPVLFRHGQNLPVFVSLCTITFQSVPICFMLSIGRKVSE